MRGAILREHGAVPRLEQTAEPRAEEGLAVVEVIAAGLNPVDISTAAGTFHGGAPELPYVVGREGVGRLGGSRVYFFATVAPHGSMAERCVIDPGSAIELPDGADETLAICCGIAGLAAWLALEWRARLAQGETVLVLGATGPVGQVALQAACLLGAGRVVAAARSEEGLRRARELGADGTVRIGAASDLADVLRTATEGGPGVIVDPLWGEPAVAAIEAAADGARLVQVGQSAGAEATIRSAAVRGKPMTIVGHTNFATPAEVRRSAYARMVEHASRGELQVDHERVPLDDVSAAWQRQAEGPHLKLVLVP